MTAESVVTKSIHAITRADLQDLDHQVPEGPLKRLKRASYSGTSYGDTVAFDGSTPLATLGRPE